VLPGKLIAFSGPHARRARWAGFQSLAPEDYWAPFRSAGVTAVVRLNKRLYDRRRFTEGGFRHHELFFPDGSCPTPQLVVRFCSLVEAEPGVVAVHCKAGLGRTGVLVGLFLMKHYSFTANEALGYLRIVRPGSIIGPQQHFLRDWEQRMWAQGDAFRSVANQPPRLPQPRISHGGGGAYDDGDISDEDADVGPAEEDYDDGGYTCGSPATLAAQTQMREAPQATAVVVQPSALRTSPTKPLHSGTRPSLLQASGKAPLASSRTMPARGAVQLRRAGGAQGSVSGDEGPLRRAGNDEASLRRSGSFGGAAAFGIQSLKRDGTSRVSPPKPAAALGASLRRSGSLPARDAMHAAQQAQPRAPATQGVAERMGGLRSSMLATLSPNRAPERASTLSSSSPGGVRQAASLAPATPDEGLLRTISALTPSTSCSPGSAGSTPGSGPALRLVTASGQPRKLPAAAAGSEACLTGTYANAYIGARVSPGGSPHGSPPLNLSPAMAALALGKLELRSGRT
jgi:protein-tyrosine phosphatase